MSAYTALISLKGTLYHINNPSRLSLVSPSRQIIEGIYNELLPWETILEALDGTRKSKSRKKVNALDGRIKETLWSFEDRVESLLSHQIILQSSEGGRERDALKLFSIDLRSLQDDADSLIRTLKFMKEEYIYEVDNMPQDDEEEEPCSSASGADYGGTNRSKMIGLSDVFGYVKQSLLYIDDERDTHIGYRLVGMGGVGKTRLAREIYEDPEIISYFDCRIWITVGRKSSARLTNDLEGSRKIVAELKGHEKCLIVVDDVWEETEELSSLITSVREMENTIIHFLFTARNASEHHYRSSYRYQNKVRFLNEEESKDLLCHRVFGENITCPPQLDSAATKIANKCEGHPLAIVTVADIISKSENRDPEYWEDVAEERNSVFTDAYTEISKVLYPTYEYLPQHLKMPLLYLGIFPPHYDIPKSKIMNRLTAEGWIVDPDKEEKYYRESYINSFLDRLCKSHGIVLSKHKSMEWHLSINHDMKSCRLHSSWRQLCRIEAKKNKFYHVLEKPSDASDQSTKGQRCLCLEYNFLFGFKEFCNLVRLDCASTTRSLLFFGPYHQYPTPIDAVGFKLLRELDALQLRFYSFPTQVLTLVQLKYLALTCNGQLPSTISKLFNLKVLIVHPHMSITKCCDTAPSSSSCIPIEIWDMKELEHIEILGKSFLPQPNDDDDDVANSLEKIDTIVGVNAASICTITKRISYIRKLGVQMEVAPYDEVNHSSDVILSCFPHISKLEYLKILKCSVINPVQGGSGSCSSPSPPRSLMMFPNGLEKLHLSGMGLPWEYIDAIGSLPCLKVLKLRSYAFRGSKWETKRNSFLRLKYLAIEDSDLVEWISGSYSFGSLNYLSLKHCYKLQEIHRLSTTYAKIELVDCNPLGVTCAKEFQRTESDGKVLPLVSASDDF